MNPCQDKWEISKNEFSTKYKLHFWVFRHEWVYSGHNGYEWVKDTRCVLETYCLSRSKKHRRSIYSASAYLQLYSMDACRPKINDPMARFMISVWLNLAVWKLFR